MDLDNWIAIIAISVSILINAYQFYQFKKGRNLELFLHTYDKINALYKDILELKPNEDEKRINVTTRLLVEVELICFLINNKYIKNKKMINEYFLGNFEKWYPLIEYIPSDGTSREWIEMQKLYEKKIMEGLIS